MGISRDQATNIGEMNQQVMLTLVGSCAESIGMVILHMERLKNLNPPS
jgi:hypothetical protein